MTFVETMISIQLSRITYERNHWLQKQIPKIAIFNHNNNISLADHRSIGFLSAHPDCIALIDRQFNFKLQSDMSAQGEFFETFKRVGKEVSGRDLETCV